MAALMRVNQLVTLRNLIASTQRTVRCISTSPKKSDTATISTTEKSTSTETVATKNKNWVYYGSYDLKLTLLKLVCQMKISYP